MLSFSHECTKYEKVIEVRFYIANNLKEIICCSVLVQYKKMHTIYLKKQLKFPLF